jgi:hypothetical protein
VTPIPTPIRDIIKAARTVARAHLELKKATRLEASHAVRKSLVRDLQRALEQLTEKVTAFELAISKAQRAPKAAFDWAGLFKTSARFLDLVKAAMDPAQTDRGHVQNVRDFVDAEVVFDDSRRPL